MFRAIFRVLPSSISNSLIAGYYRISQFRSAGGSHSLPQEINMSDLIVKIFPALQDNYMYLIVDPESKKAAVVDPVEPGSLLQAVREEGLELTAVLTTHHHWDHSGGNKKLIEEMKSSSGAGGGGGDVIVYGGDSRVEAVSQLVSDGEVLRLGGLTVSCLHTPCHTTGHICYLVSSAAGQPRAVFTGDTLFIGGCGKFFEGDAQMMYNALIKKLSALPDDVKVYCGHEYTVQNLKFAKLVEPQNPDLQNKLAWAIEMRANSKPTVPSTIGEEKEYNPFMRVSEKSVQESVKAPLGDLVRTMGDLRKKKDVTKIQ